MRVKQLTGLLTQAKIPIPSGPSIKLLGKRRLKWTNKLCADDLENKRVPDEPGECQAADKISVDDNTKVKEDGSGAKLPKIDDNSKLGKQLSDDIAI